jgi:hypothetical protein
MLMPNYKDGIQSVHKKTKRSSIVSIFHELSRRYNDTSICRLPVFALIFPSSRSIHSVSIHDASCKFKISIRPMRQLFQCSD